MAIGKLAPEKIGSLIGGGFGLVFILVNTGSLPTSSAAVLRGLAALALLAVLVAIWRVDPAPQSGAGGFARGYWLVVAAEAIALFGGLAVINQAFHAPQAAIAWVALAVGAHFVALAMVWRLAFFHLLGWTIAACGAAGLALAATGADERVIDVLSGVTPGGVRPLIHTPVGASAGAGGVACGASILRPYYLAGSWGAPRLSSSPILQKF